MPTKIEPKKSGSPKKATVGESRQKKEETKQRIRIKIKSYDHQVIDSSVRQIVEEGVQETVDLMNEFNTINDQFAEPMSDEEMDKLIQRQSKVQEKLGCIID